MNPFKNLKPLSLNQPLNGLGNYFFIWGLHLVILFLKMVQEWFVVFKLNGCSLKKNEWLWTIKYWPNSVVL